MKLQTVLIALSALFLVACGKQNSGNSGSTRINRTQSNQVAIGTTTCSQSAWGKIYDDTVDAYSYRQRVADFTLRTLDEVGEISGAYNSSTGIEFQTSLIFSGGSLTQNSTASFKISDSYTVNENGGYISFAMNGNSGSGSGGGFEAIVGDQKGYVYFKGSRTTSGGQSVVTGVVYYNNYNQGWKYLGKFVNGSCGVVGI